MKRSTIISSLCLLLLLVSVMGYGHSRSDKKKHQFLRLCETNIGFYKGVKVFDVAKNGYCSKHKTLTSSGIIVRMPVVSHFKVEVAIDYTHFLNFPKQENQVITAQNYSAVSVPVSIQYYFLPKKCRVQPYFGAGTIIYSDVKNSLSLIENGEIKPAPQGTRYISVMFTQGIIFEINPKIQVSESLHFINEGGKNSVGINFGIGFKLP
jgi:hypothetical protein